MGVMDWLSLLAIVFSIIAFMFSWKWASDSTRNLVEIRRIADGIERSVDERTREIERKVEERTKDIERIVDDRTRIIEQKVEERMSDLIRRTAPSMEETALANIMAQMGPQLFQTLLSDPNLLREIMLNSQNKKSGRV